MSAPNADEPNTDNTGRQTNTDGAVKVEATGNADVHLGDGRVIHGNGDGHHEDGAGKPKSAMVTPEVAEVLVKLGKAKRA